MNFQKTFSSHRAKKSILLSLLSIFPFLANATSLAVGVLITPLKSFKASELLNSENRIKKELSCIKGGFGWTKTSTRTQKTPSYFQVKELHLSWSRQLDERVGIQTRNDLTEIVPKIDDETFKNNDNAAMMRELFKEGVIQNTTLAGDSGGGLLCKREGEPYRLAGIVCNGPIEEIEEGSDRYELINRFSMLPEDWEEKRLIAPTFPIWD